MRSNFKITRNEDKTYDVADKKGNVFASHVKNFRAVSNLNYIITTNAESQETLYNKNGQVMPEAKDVECIRCYRDGSYDVNVHFHYDNGYKGKNSLKVGSVILGGLFALAGVGAIVQGSAQKNREVEAAQNTEDATYLGSAVINGNTNLFFDTDGKKGAEYSGKAGTYEAAGLIPELKRGTVQKVGQWRATGFDMIKLNKELIKQQNQKN